MGRGGEAAATLARTIAGCAAEKQLARARAAFDEFVANGGTPSRQVLSTLMNAHVLSGDRAGAAEVADRMRDRGFALGVVEFTTLLKGELAAGDLRAGQRLLDEMLSKSPPVLPDVRTANTFMRGCLKLGELAEALALFARLPAWGVAPDAASHKIALQSRAQLLRLDDALGHLEELQKGAGDALQGLDNAVGLRASAAQAALLLGKRKRARRLLEEAEASLGADGAGSSGGSRGFDDLRRLELAREVKWLRVAAEEAEPFDLAGCLARTFAFPAMRGGEAEGAGDDGADPAGAVAAALRRGFGLEACERQGVLERAAFEARLRRNFRSDGRLRWPRVFGTKGLPTKLEICSGTGDWVVAQARAEARKANWLASELRYDRVHSIFSKMAFARVDNLGLLAGDAAWILQARVPRNSLSNVCVNFPEPPQTTRAASCDDAESQLHLLTPEFFRSVHAALAEQGILTIFSDNEQYTLSLARTLGSLRAADGGRLYEPSSEVPVEHLEEAEEMGGMLVCKATPGPEVGHAVSAASQFDRFFSHGDHSARFYIAAMRVGTPNGEE
eukprot:TRINITY_DN3205_c0_g1_i1.p1 TRINITY_DN3205_c0_g1~~TRINITY_DN3205_c0_g1_i1.p1  ORF type:complete len:560 (+),score=162.63 TRINITY_DN3205_c0_g1_i1:1477-3156(+)